LLSKIGKWGNFCLYVCERQNAAATVPAAWDRPIALLMNSAGQ
jgi:hypothetical protein